MRGFELPKRKLLKFKAKQIRQKVVRGTDGYVAPDRGNIWRSSVYKLLDINQNFLIIGLTI